MVWGDWDGNGVSNSFFFYIVIRIGSRCFLKKKV